jgi:hypothetical protein
MITRFYFRRIGHGAHAGGHTAAEQAYLLQRCFLIDFGERNLGYDCEF